MAEQPLLDVARVAAGLPAGWRLDHRPSVSSTMDVARAAAVAGAAEGLTVVAEEQTAGRGRLGRAWRSTPGANLAFTVVLRPDLALVRRLAMAVPLAVAEGIAAATGIDAGIKWPNDVQIVSRKCAGVLIDVEMEGATPLFALAGIGLNVNHDPSADPELASIATSLSARAGRPLDRETVLLAVLNALHGACAAVRRGEDVRERWRARLVTLGQQIGVRSGNTVEYGIAEDVDDDGGLLLRRDDGALLAFAAGEVTLRV